MASNTEPRPGGFLLGCALRDITGPAAERGMMGYASPFQKTGGIHMRLWSRAFIIESADKGTCLAFVCADLCMISQAVKLETVARLRDRHPGIFTADNVMLTATHTHAGPGGYSHYTLYDITTLGFDRQNFEAIVNGIVESICLAYANRKPGTIRIAAGALTGATKNRSPQAYARNKPKELAFYGSNTDDSMVVLRLEQEGGAELGMISWYAIHGTSLPKENRLISGDNKGYASYLFEKLKNPREVTTPFVAAFAQSNEGDISPNVYGGDDGRGNDPFAGMATSGDRQFQAALALYNQAKEVVPGRVAVRHAHVDMSEVEVAPEWTGQPGTMRTSRAAIGVSMLAGTEDGRGIGWEGVSQNRLRRFLRRIVIGALLLWAIKPFRFSVLFAWVTLFRKRRDEGGQGQKVSLIPTGYFRPPWTPQVLPFQVAQIGTLGIVAVPFECTTMAGRRLKATALKQLEGGGVTTTVIAGLANAYAGYMTTHEEYEHQDYEGASTHFGPWTLGAARQTVARLAAALAADQPVDPGVEPGPPDDTLLDLQTTVWVDAPPPGKSFGSARRRPRPFYKRGDTVVASFWAGHPKNNLRSGDTFLKVERQDASGWVQVACDHDPETRFIWRRWLLFCLPFSTATVAWTIPENATAGTYRIRLYGERKPLFRSPHSYGGESRPFTVP